MKGRPARSMIITGLRGVGKTVLLNEFRERAEYSGWVTVEFEASKHDENRFRQQIAMRLRTTLLRISPSKKMGRSPRKSSTGPRLIFYELRS